MGSLVNGGDGARTPRIKLRLRTLLVLVSLFVLLLPLVGVYMLRIHETTLLRQTEADLRIVATLVSAAYQTMLLELANDVPRQGAEIELATPSKPPLLDFGTADIAPPFPAPVAAAPADRLAMRVGERIAPLLDNAAEATKARIWLLDGQGVVVATTASGRGESLAHVGEVGEALAGQVGQRLRRVAKDTRLPVEGVVRGATVEVSLAYPILSGLSGDKLVGVAVVSRRPSNILDALYAKRVLLMQGAAVFLVVGFVVAIIAARTLVLPIRRLARAATQVSRGEATGFERGRPYRVHELAELADSIEAMVSNLHRRTNYLRDFARHVSHAFKTPIAAMRGAAELLRDDATMSPEDAKHFVDNIADDIERLERLTQGLVAMAQADMATVSDETTDVQAVARSVAKAGVHVADGPPAWARIPRTSIHAVLHNLIDNAFDYGASRVDLLVAKNGAAVELTVRDDGPGISAGNREHVFDPFFTTRKDQGGTGLGLAICRTLIHTAGGHIVLAPSASGALFKVTLPAAPEVSPSGTSAASAA